MTTTSQRFATPQVDLDRAHQIQAALGTQVPVPVIAAVLAAADNTTGLHVDASNSTGVDLDGDQMSISQDDDQISIVHRNRTWDGTGPLLTVYGFDDRDADQLLRVADWLEQLELTLADAVEVLRTRATNLCPTCRGVGGWSHHRSSDVDCNRCGGSGVIA